MLKKLHQWAERFATYNTIWQAVGLGGVMTIGGIGAWLAHATGWISAYGPYAWLLAGLLAAIGAATVMLLVAFARYRWNEGAALTHWAETVDGVNPLDKEFSNKRIRIADLAHPVSKSIVGKVFRDCELVGPAILCFRGQPQKRNAPPGSAYFKGVSFVNCDLVVLRKATFVPTYNAIFIDDITVIGGEIMNCLIIMTEQTAKSFTSMPGMLGAGWLTLSGDPEFDEKLSSLPPPSRPL